MDTRIAGGIRLVHALWTAPKDRQFFKGLLIGTITHLAFAAGVCAMIWAMFHGMSKSFGTIPTPWSWGANTALLLFFPLTHSFLLSNPGTRLLIRLGGKDGQTLSTTTYALIASLQLLLLYTLWSPSTIVWYTATGPAFVGLCAAYTLSWLFLMKASFDAGAEVQSGALGWMSLSGKRPVQFPDMPTKGTFRFIRQPIYLAFALTLWTVPTWTPDQLYLASIFTLYCILAPKLKEKRFGKRYKERFKTYKENTPYMVPR